MAGSVVGRDAELASIEAFVTSVPDAAAALVLHGEAGMGKTTLWVEALVLAEAHGLRTLRASPAESETAFSFSGLGDVLHPVLDEALASLPSPQRSALSRALLLDDDGPAPDPHVIGVAVLNAFRALAAAGPMLVAVDDVQWLDEASAGALAYAARRLRSEPVGVLLARRERSESALLAELDRSFPSERLTTIEVGPLDVASLHRLLHDQLGVALPRRLLGDVHDASGGNPFYALEIVRMLQRSGGAVDAGQPLPLPESLQDLVHGRLLALPAASRRYLLAAAAQSQPTTVLAEAASGVGRGAGLTPALEARVVELDGERIRFTHPLLAGGAYEIADPVLRRETHARLAELLDDPEEKAWQLAASAVEADEAVAAQLEAAARHARSRGAPGAAALLLDRAGGLTPEKRAGDAFRRALDAASLHFESGDSRRAEAQLRALIEPLPAGAERAKALLLLARVRLYEAPHEARELFAQVLAEGVDDRPTLALAHEGAAACSVWTFEGFEEGLRHIELALALADELRDDALVADILMTRITAEAMLGRPEAKTTAERALALQELTGEFRILDQPLVSLGEYWAFVDEHERARVVLTELLQRAQELGDENARPWILSLLARVERVLGRPQAALDLVHEGRQAAEQSGQPLFEGLNVALEAAILADLGRVEEAREAARRAQELTRDRYAFMLATGALAHVELASGAPEAAAAALAPTMEYVHREGIVEPGALPFVVDRVEALIELGHAEEALELLEWFEGHARRAGRASALATAARSRGLLAAAGGDLAGAVAAYEEALAWHAQVELPLDRGRTLLALGAAQRRTKRRREARETLEEALGVFERIGAALWAERARGELARIGGRAPSAGALTPAEARVAALVARGRTNREVAAALFLSERTVESHLSRVYGKLGVRSRTELARALDGGGG